MPCGGAAAVVGAVALAGTNALFNWVQAQETYETTADYLAMIEGHRAVLLWGDALGLLAAPPRAGHLGGVAPTAAPHTRPRRDRGMARRLGRRTSTRSTTTPAWCR